VSVACAGSNASQQIATANVKNRISFMVFPFCCYLGVPLMLRQRRADLDAIELHGKVSAIGVRSLWKDIGGELVMKSVFQFTRFEDACTA